MCTEKFERPQCEEPGMSWISFGSDGKEVIGKDHGDHAHPHQCMASSSISGLIVKEPPIRGSHERGND